MNEGDWRKIVKERLCSVFRENSSTFIHMFSLSLIAIIVDSLRI